MSESDSRQPFARLFSAHASWGERSFLLWDLAIVALVTLNLALILVDTLFVIGPVQNLLALLWPAGYETYKEYVHANFLTIDLAFVSIFVLDVLAGWAVAIHQRRYARWFFYPFVHWYDVLGCVPLAGFRFLRVLRIIAILARLQRLGVIDIRNWAAFRRALVYYDILAEEISDRVAIKMLGGMQDELQSGGDRVTRRAVDEVLEPRRQWLVERTASELERVIGETYQAHRDDLQRYVADVVHRGVARNAAIRNLQRLPVLGRTLNHALDDAIRDTVNSVLDETIESCTRAEFERVMQVALDQVVAQLVADQRAAPSELHTALIETLELVKDQVAVKQWQSYFNSSRANQTDRPDHPTTPPDRATQT